jgi:hypothetical protein
VVEWLSAGSGEAPRAPAQAAHSLNLTSGPGALHAHLPGGSLRAGYVYTLTAALRATARWSWSAAALPHVRATGGFLPGIPLPVGLGASAFVRTRSGRVEPGGGPCSLTLPASPLPALLYGHLPPLQSASGLTLATPHQGGRALTTRYNVSSTGWAGELDWYLLEPAALQAGSAAQALLTGVGAGATLPPPLASALAQLAAGSGSGSGSGASVSGGFGGGASLPDDATRASTPLEEMAAVVASLARACRRGHCEATMAPPVDDAAAGARVRRRWRGAGTGAAECASAGGWACGCSRCRG